MTGTTLQRFHNDLDEIAQLAETDKAKATQLVELLTERIKQEINNQV